MAVSKSPDDGPEENPANWTTEATLGKEEYFRKYLANADLNGTPSPNDVEFDPDLADLLTTLYERQRREAFLILDDAHSRLGPGSDDDEFHKFHKAKFRAEFHEECERFEEERDRHIREYHKAKAIRAEMNEPSREEQLIYHYFDPHANVLKSQGGAGASEDQQQYVAARDYFSRYLRDKPAEDAAFEPELQELLTKLYDRQREQADELILFHMRRQNNSEFVPPETNEEIIWQFEKEYRDFDRERDRYIRQYNEAKDILAKINELARDGKLQQEPDDNEPKMAR